MRRHLPAVALLVVALLFAGFVWPTPWAYYTVDGGAGAGGALVRRNRITGAVEAMYPYKRGPWRPLND